MVAIFTTIVFISVIVYFLSPQFSGFVQDIPSIKSHLSDHFNTAQKWVYQKFNFTVKEQASIIGQTFLSVTETLMVIILLPVYNFLILYYRNIIRKFLIALFKREHENKIKEVLQESRSIAQ